MDGVSILVIDLTVNFGNRKRERESEQENLLHDNGIKIDVDIIR